MVLTNLPDFFTSFPARPIQTVEDTGQWVSNDNWGDGQIIIAEGKYRIIFRSGVPASGGDPNGLQYNEKVYDGDIYNGWGAITGPGPESGLERPHKAIISSHASNVGNIDTGCLVYNPTTGLYLASASCKPGSVAEGESGYVYTIQYWQSSAPARTSDVWTQPVDGHHVIDGRETANLAATWAQGYDVEAGTPVTMKGGCQEQSVVYDAEDDKLVFFWEGAYRDEAQPEWNGLAIEHFAIGRADADAADFDESTAVTPIWTPVPAVDSYVWRPNENGMKESEVYGETEETAVWGTSEKVTLRSNVTINPVDGVYHMVLQQKKPSLLQGRENRSSGIGHYYSLDKGLTWTADSNNPLVTWEKMGAVNGEQANKLNSPFLVWDTTAAKVFLCFWYNDNGLLVSTPGTRLVALEAPIEVWPQTNPLIPYTGTGEPSANKGGSFPKRYGQDVTGETSALWRHGNRKGDHVGPPRIPKGGKLG